MLSDVIKEHLNEQVDSVTEAITASNENTRRHISETIQRNSEKVVTEVVKSSKEQMDNDAVAREQRKCNLIIRDVSESDANSPRERQEEDREFAQRLLKIRNQQLVRVTRAGPPIGSRQNDNRISRPMIITVETPELASHLHDHGRGWKVRGEQDEIYWVNADLIQADREANYKARMLARRRRQGGFVLTDAVGESPTQSHHNSPVIHANRVPIVARRRQSLSSVSSTSSHQSHHSHMSGSREDLR